MKGVSLLLRTCPTLGEERGAFDAFWRRRIWREAGHGLALATFSNAQVELTKRTDLGSVVRVWATELSFSKK